MQYFRIGLALPNASFWVNLRPDQEDNIIEGSLAKTDLGKVLLEADLQLKKDLAAFTSPDTPEGKLYWDKLYARADQLFGEQEVELPTYTRPWIVPGEIILRETSSSQGRVVSSEGKANPSAYIYKATLKVMLEEDYISSQGRVVRGEGSRGLKKTSPVIARSPATKYQDDETIFLTQQQTNFTDPRLKELNSYSSELIRQLIIPKLTKTVNSSKRYAPLRQVYYSLILAQWFKTKHRDLGAPEHQSTRAPGTSTLVSTGALVTGTLGTQSSYLQLIDSGNLTGLTSTTPWDKATYYTAYRQSFEQGEYNRSETVWTPSGPTIRSYVSGVQI